MAGFGDCFFSQKKKQLQLATENSERRNGHLGKRCPHREQLSNLCHHEVL
jgi:hypothetical protein